MDFNAVITGDRVLEARFAEWPKELHDSLYHRIAKLTDQLLGRVKALAPEQTGTLKNEIIARVFDDPERIKGYVSLEGGLDQNAYVKAAALEYGAHKSFAVSRYRRTITEAFGCDISPKRIAVEEYRRTANIDERMYLRGALAEIEAEAVVELTEAINEKIEE
jgi:hypothetical protein